MYVSPNIPGKYILTFKKFLKGAGDTYGSPLPPEVLEHNPGLKYYPDSSLKTFGSYQPEIPESSLKTFGSYQPEIPDEPIQYEAPKPVHLPHSFQHQAGKKSGKIREIKIPNTLESA